MFCFSKFDFQTSTVSSPPTIYTAFVHWFAPAYSPLVTVVNFIGMVLVRANAASGHLGNGCIAGFYMLKVSKLIQHDVILVCTVLLVIRIVSGLNDAYGSITSVSEGMLYGASVGITVITGVAVIFFHLLNVISVSVMKEAIKCKTPITSAHILSAIGSFLLAAATLSMQLYMQFNLTLLLASGYCVLLGLHSLQFRSAMREMEATE